jgi:YtkA-like protein
MSHRTRLVVSAGLLGALVGCGSGGGGAMPPPAVDGAPPATTDGPPPSVADAEPVPDDAFGFDPDADVFIPCTDDPRAEHYAPGMLKTGPKSQISVTLLSSDPGPPIKGVNTWSVLVTDAAKAPQSGATLKVVPYMPDHNHGTIVKPTITPLSDAGQYKVTPLYLFMAGLWEVTLTVSTPTGVQDAVVFRFCIQQ